MLRKIVQGMAVVGVVMGVGALGAGCLDRPVTSASPTIKTNFTSAVNQSGINKVDILFDIDNSASMGDKQTYLIQAIPQMIARLVTPNCIDDKTGAITGTASSSTGQCASTTSSPEFQAVHDMHIGVVTSSLGSRLGIAAGTGSDVTYVCDPTQMVTSAPSSGSVSVSAYNDDQGHLINRTGSFGASAGLPEAALSEGGGFLYWFPALGNGTTAPIAPPSTPLKTIGAAGQAMTLVGDFTELVGGAGESGCGIESQLESWYRFLIQPDPYLSLTSTGGKAAWSGVDTTIIQQRHDFLRPDSLVAIIVLSDENDSEIDVRSYQGSGYYFMSNTYTPPRATTACETTPLDPTCSSCSGCGQMGGPPASVCTDPNCTTNGGVFNQSNDSADWGWDLNLRHVHMLQKYGLNPQYPLTRYYNGLTSKTVPNRVGEYPSASSSYAGNNNCTNPLFATNLPTAADVPDSMSASPTEIGTTLCNLTGGATRTAADVFYAHIGGVPHQLLQVDSATCLADGCKGLTTDPASCQTDPNCQQKAALSPADWTSILGQGQAAYLPPTFTPSYDYTGIDPHMIESMTPRNVSGLPNSEPAPMSTPGVATLSGPTFAAGGNPAPDPVNGREWTTSKGVHSLPVDREYACIFQLPPTSQRDCAAIPDNTIENNSCDCVPAYSTASPPVPGPTMNSLDEVPPLCAKTSTDGTITSAVGDYTVQTYAKAYPTIRELTLANMMGTQGIVSSLCPIHTTDNAAGDDPTYGYRPAVNAIVNRLKSALGSTCVPQLILDSSTHEVPCLVLVSFSPTSTDKPAKQGECAQYSTAYSEPDPTVLSEFQMNQAALAGDGGTTNDLATDITCALNQVATPSGSTCVGGSANGWCYVTGAGISGGSTCSQEIAYSTASLVPNGATINLQCISTNQKSGDAGAAATGDSGH